MERLVERGMTKNFDDCFFTIKLGNSKFFAGDASKPELIFQLVYR